MAASSPRPFLQIDEDLEKSENLFKQQQGNQSPFLKNLASFNRGDVMVYIPTPQQIRQQYSIKSNLIKSKYQKRQNIISYDLKHILTSQLPKTHVTFKPKDDNLLFQKRYQNKRDFRNTIVPKITQPLRNKFGGRNSLDSIYFQYDKFQEPPPMYSPQMMVKPEGALNNNKLDPKKSLISSTCYLKDLKFQSPQPTVKSSQKKKFEETVDFFEFNINKKSGRCAQKRNHLDFEHISQEFEKNFRNLRFKESHPRSPPPDESSFHSQQRVDTKSDVKRPGEQFQLLSKPPLINKDLDGFSIKSENFRKINSEDEMHNKKSGESPHHSQIYSIKKNNISPNQIIFTSLYDQQKSIFNTFNKQISPFDKNISPINFNNNAPPSPFKLSHATSNKNRVSNIPSSSSLQTIQNLLPRYNPCWSSFSKGPLFKGAKNKQSLPQNLGQTLTSIGIAKEVEKIKKKAQNSKSAPRIAQKKPKLNLRISNSPIEEGRISAQMRTQRENNSQFYQMKRKKLELRKKYFPKAPNFKRRSSQPPPNLQSKENEKYKEIVKKIQKDDNYILTKEYLQNNEYLKSPKQSQLPPVLYFKPMLKPSNNENRSPTAAEKKPMTYLQKLEKNRYPKSYKQQELNNLVSRKKINEWNYKKNMQELIQMKKKKIQELYKTFNVRGCRVLKSKLYEDKQLKQILTKQEKQEIDRKESTLLALQNVIKNYQFQNSESNTNMTEFTEKKWEFQKIVPNQESKAEIVSSQKSRKTILSRGDSRALNLRSNSLQSEFYREDQASNQEQSEISSHLRAKISSYNILPDASCSESPSPRRKENEN